MQIKRYTARSCIWVSAISNLNTCKAWTESSPEEKNMGVLEDEKLNMRQQ